MPFSVIQMQVTLNTLNTLHSIPLEKSATESEQLLLRRISQGDRTAFWQLWGRYQDYLSRRCLTWMGCNRTDASEALSRATLKAWDKLPNYAGKITNPRAWLTRLTHNVCMDMHRERSRGAKGIESIEEIAIKDEETAALTLASPESAVLRRELGMTIRRAINALPLRLRDPFILRYYHNLSYQDIAQQLALSVANVRKRIQQAREILQKQLNKYLAGLNDLSLEKHQSHTSPTTSDWEAPITVGHTLDQINYRITALCLNLPRTWYSSPSLLG